MHLELRSRNNTRKPKKGSRDVSPTKSQKSNSVTTLENKYTNPAYRHSYFCKQTLAAPPSVPIYMYFGEQSWTCATFLHIAQCTSTFCNAPGPLEPLALKMSLYLPFCQARRDHETCTNTIKPPLLREGPNGIPWSGFMKLLVSIQQQLVSSLQNCLVWTTSKKKQIGSIQLFGMESYCKQSTKSSNYLYRISIHRHMS